MAALQQLRLFVGGLASVQLGPAELRKVHEAFISSIVAPVDAAALLQSVVEYANSASSHEQLILLCLQRNLIARPHADAFGGWLADRLLKQLTAGEVEHRSEMGQEIAQCLVDLASVSANATTRVLNCCNGASALPALAALLTRPPLSREDAVVEVAQHVLNSVFSASGSLEAALQAASRSLFPAYVNKHKQQPAMLKPFLERLWKTALNVAGLSEESVNVSFSWLCQFYPHYFHNGAVVDLRGDATFWSLLRNGFLSNSSGVRKKAGYILKRLLDDVKRAGGACKWSSFAWEPKSAAEAEKAWNSFFLLYETTEDFALHLIQDAWQQLETLFDAHTSIQPAWLSVLLQRLLRHENPAVKKFALVQLLQINDARLERLEESFVLATLLQALSDASVYKGTAGEYIEAEAVPFLLRYWRMCGSTHAERYLRAFVEAARQHLSTPHIGIATAFLSSIEMSTPAWDSVAFAALGDIVSRKIANQPRHARLRMLEHIARAVCRFTDLKAITSPRQAAAVLGAYPRSFFAERPALREELRRWQDSLGGGGGKASLLREAVSGLSRQSNAPEADQLQESEALAEQTAALLSVGEAEGEALVESLLRAFVWPKDSVLHAEKALGAIGALCPAVVVPPARLSALDPSITATVERMKVFADQRVIPSLTQPLDLPLDHSLLSIRVFLRAFSALFQFSPAQSHQISHLRALAQTILSAAKDALTAASSGAARVEFQKLRGMETVHALVSTSQITVAPGDFLPSLLRASVTRPKDNTDIASTWSHRVATFALHKWEAVLALLQRDNARKDKALAIAVLEEARSALDSLVPEMLSTILSVLKAVLPACIVSLDAAAVGELLLQVWHAVLEHADLAVVSAFAAFAFAPIFLPYHEQLRPIFAKVLDFALASGHPLVPYVAVHFLDSCIKSEHVLHYEEEILQLLLYGPLRTDMDAVKYKEAEPLEVDVNGCTQTVYHQDAFVRAAAIAALRAPSAALVERIVVKLLEETLTLSKRNYRQYTYQHRRAVRMWQVLSLLTPHLHPALEAPINQRLWRILDMTHMKSVRQYIDLFASNFLLQFPSSVHSQFLPLLERVNGKLELLGSALGIARELLLHWPKLPSFDEKLYQQLFITLMPYSSCNNLVLRTQAQVAIVKLMQQPGFRSKIQSCGDLKMLEALNSYLNTNHECAKYLEKYGSLFGAGDVLQVVRLPELLLYAIPITEKLPAAESISLKILASLGISSAAGAALVNNIAVESEAEPEAHAESSGDTIQKKIEPWADIVVDDQLSRETILLRKRQGIIMCASLVDKIPNLGGLARTSEVFSATAIAVPYGRVESDPQFQQVSVNAEKWIPLLEVPPFELAGWLQQKRAEGYRILAVEQTSNSVSLEAYKFPQHAVLLLGKEKEGIPVEFLHLVDDRSLNVHVSGAIVLWEYTRQQLVKNRPVSKFAP